MKIQKIHIADDDTALFAITDSTGASINIAPEEALELLEYFNRQRGELTRMINSLRSSARICPYCGLSGEYDPVRGIWTHEDFDCPSQPR